MHQSRIYITVSTVMGFPGKGIPQNSPQKPMKSRSVKHGNRNLHRTWPVHSSRASPSFTGVSFLQYPSCLHWTLACPTGAAPPSRKALRLLPSCPCSPLADPLLPASSPGCAGGHGQGKGSAAKALPCPSSSTLLRWGHGSQDDLE